MLLKKHFLEFSFESGFCGYDYPCMFDVNLLIKLINLREALAQQNLDYSSRIYYANNWYMLIANDVANVVAPCCCQLIILFFQPPRICQYDLGTSHGQAFLFIARTR